MTAVIRELAIFLGLKFDKGKFDEVEKKYDKIARNARVLIKVADEVGEAFFRQINAVSRSATELDEYRRQIGGTIEEMSALRFAAEGVGFESKKAFEAVTELGERASDVIRNDKNFKSEAAEGFKALGLRAKDLKQANGQMKTSLELFNMLVERLPRLKFEGDRTGVLMRTLGDDVGRIFAGLDLETFQQLRKEAGAFGVVMSKTDVLIGRRFSVNFNVLLAQLKAFRDRVGLGILPGLNKLIGRLRRWFKANKQIIESDFTRWMDRLGEVLRFTAGNA